MTLQQLDKKYLQKRHRIFGRDRQPNRIPARFQERLSNKSRKVREFIYECPSMGARGFSCAVSGVVHVCARLSKLL